MSADNAIHDGTAAIMWALLEDGTDPALAGDDRLPQRCAALRDLVGSRVWTPRISNERQYKNLTKAIWFSEVMGDGPDEHGEDTARMFEFTALGGTTTGTLTGGYAAKDAENVARALAGVLGLLHNIVTPYGMICSCVPETGFEYGYEDDLGWPWWKQVWTINTGAI